MILFYNALGQQIGHCQDTVFNTSFEVGRVKSLGERGGRIISRGNVGLFVGFVTEDGTILHDKEGIKPGIISDAGTVNKSKSGAAKKITTGRVEISGDIGIVYDINGKKVGEVRGAGVDTKVYGGALLTLLVDVDPKNAPYSRAFNRYEVPKPPSGGVVSRVEPDGTNTILSNNIIEQFYIFVNGVVGVWAKWARPTAKRSTFYLTQSRDKGGTFCK